MNYSKIEYNDINSGKGIRTSIYVSGCRNYCINCIYPEAKDFNYGNLYTEEVQKKLFDSVDDDTHDGITILGGEPLDNNNIDSVWSLIHAFRERYGENKTIWVYSGYTYTDIMNRVYQYKNKCLENIMHNINVLVDGPFIESQKDYSKPFITSRNQKIIKLK